MTFKQYVQKVHPSAFCCRATWGGFHVWLCEDKFQDDVEKPYPWIVGWGGSSSAAWQDAYNRLLISQKENRR